MPKVCNFPTGKLDGLRCLPHGQESERVQVGEGLGAGKRGVYFGPSDDRKGLGHGKIMAEARVARKGVLYENRL